MGPYFTLNPSHASRFWMPDVFIDQAKALRSPTYYTKPASLRVYNDSTIRYSSRSEINYDITLHFAPRATDTVGDVKTGIVSDFTRPSAGGTGL